MVIMNYLRGPFAPHNMKIIFLATILLFPVKVFAQDIIDWDGQYQLQLSDFKSEATQIGDVNVYSLASGAQMNFGYQMTNGEFMFTKNFNSKVNCYFDRSLAAIISPDTVRASELVNFARYEFDLAELSARKLRKRIFEDKRTSSDGDFFEPLYKEAQREFTIRHTAAAKETDLGHDAQKLNELHAAVLAEIAALSDFCKTCKPPKKKKK